MWKSEGFTSDVQMTETVLFTVFVLKALGLSSSKEGLTGTVLTSSSSPSRQDFCLLSQDTPSPQMYSPSHPQPQNCTSFLFLPQSPAFSQNFIMQNTSNPSPCPEGSSEFKRKVMFPQKKIVLPVIKIETFRLLIKCIK